MGMIFLSILSLSSSSQKHFANQSNKADSLFNCRYPLIWMARDIKESIQVFADPVSVNGNYFSTSSNCLVLKIPSVDSSGYIIDVDNTHDTIIFWQHSQYPNQLMRTVIANELSARSDRSRIINSSLHSMNFDYYRKGGTSTSSFSEAAMIQVTLSAQFQGQGKKYLESFSTSVKLRNKMDD
jgi:hypothetical protein